MDAALSTDLERWHPRASRFASLRICRDEGWTINGFRREWHGAMAIHFMEIVKGNERVRPPATAGTRHHTAQQR